MRAFSATCLGQQWLNALCRAERGVPHPFKTRVEITFGGAIIAESGPGPAAWLANWAGWRAELGNLAGWRKKVIISRIL